MPRRRIAAWIEAVLLVLLAIQAARLLWMLIPIPMATHSIPVVAGAATQPVPLSGHDPFEGPAGAAGTPAQDPDAWTLHGVRTASGDGPGAAFLSRGTAAQAVYTEGAEIEPGLVLESVAADHVLLRAGSRSRRIALPRGALPQATPAAAAALPAGRPGATPAAASSVDPSQLLSQAGLQARRESGRVTGYVVMPGGNDDLARQAGLQPGDVLLSVNGQPLDPERLQQLAEELGRDARAEIVFQRGGERRTTHVGGDTP